jgi:DeoR family transcriptional regulator, suf operon transcriptional repressor
MGEDAVVSAPRTPSEPPLATMRTTRRAILVALKRSGAMSAHDLAELLGITVAAVRQQLVRLEHDGLVAHRCDPDGRGRPTHSYQVTSGAEELFPKRYGDLTTELLGYLGGPDSSEVTALFEQRRRRRLAGAGPRLADRTLDEQVAELTAILDEDGYLADVERLDDGGWRITEHNCAILSVANGYRQACSSELAFIRDALPGAQVERVAHLMDGAHVCAYEVHPRSS